MFSNEKNGYNKKEVDKKIQGLLKELTEQSNTIQEKHKLNIALASALEKSKEIEANTKNLYDLKIQKILIMYKNLANSFQNLFTVYPQLKELNDIKKSFDKFNYTIETTLLAPDDPKNNLTSAVNTENDTIRLLLSKMSSYSKNQTDTPEKTVKIKRKDSKKSKTLTKGILTTKVLEHEDYISPADKFLESTETQDNSVYAKIINNKRPDDLYPTPNESGFDLKEAVNPKDDLDAIMQSFDFYNEDN